MQVGDVVEGTVATIQPYGAFVNLGADLNGLLHISQISHDRISSVEQVLEVGQKLKVSLLISPSVSTTIWQACRRSCAAFSDLTLILDNRKGRTSLVFCLPDLSAKMAA